MTTPNSTAAASINQVKMTLTPTDRITKHLTALQDRNTMIRVLNIEGASEIDCLC